ncbi:deoxycytidine deaminase [Candidatus Nomurabacteria bacterium]|nr:deoxycytidine deaminase [Candidatus Nomurabacteria bacterium]
MILTGSEIKRQVENGSIQIEPFDADLVNPNSYNYRLGEYISEFESQDIDPKKEPQVKTYRIPSEGVILYPNKLYLGHTLESIGSYEYVASLIGRSSVGRLGLFLQITADLGQLGKAHQWTLELKVVQPLRLYSGMKIGQVSFWQPDGEINAHYTKGYVDHNMPRSSSYHEAMKEESSR